MLLIPAIDIKNNLCVRLEKGNFDKISIFSNNPILFVEKWLNLGAKRLHIIDLDGALNGKPKNLFIIKSILNYVNNKIELQIGGGIRSLDVIKYYFDIGFSYVILGTKAVTDLNFFYDVCNKFPKKIILSLDLKNNKIAINGWKNFCKVTLKTFFKSINNFNIESIICTDINRDGMLNNININMLLKVSKLTNKPIIASGGLKDIFDIKNVFNLQKNNILGVICGKSIYTKNLDFKNIQNKIDVFNKFYINY